MASASRIARQHLLTRKVAEKWLQKQKKPATTK